MKQIEKLIRRYRYKLFTFIFWLSLWKVASIAVHKEILVASPEEVLLSLLDLIQSGDFWMTIVFSAGRILFGFVLALTTGALFAAAAYKSRLFRELISPMMKVIKSTPVASFIILALIWINSRNLSILISFLMMVPIAYTNVGQGLEGADGKLLQMAEVFHLSRYKRIKAIYLPSVIPHLISAVSVGLGFCFKAGIAAEVIGTPVGSIGERLYEAKLYLMTKELFAWTIVIIIISILFENVVMFIIRRFTTNRNQLEETNI